MTEQRELGTHARERREDIQALRGIAVLVVVLQHAALGPFAHGYLGVDMFFVISGFLITGIISREILRGDFSFAGFYMRRARRILPAALVTIALTAIGSIWFVNSVEADALRAQVLGALTFSINFILWFQTGYFDVGAELKPLLHMWSLAIEEQFYLLFPALLFFVPRRFWRAAILVLIFASATLCFAWYVKDPSGAFYLLPTRAWELGIGAYGALMSDRLRQWKGFRYLFLPALVLLLSLTMVSISEVHPGIDALLVCGATLVVILAGINGRRASIAFWPLARLGDISYSLYLVHWPVLVFLTSSYVGPAPLWFRLSALAICILLAILLYVFVERPPLRHPPTSAFRFAAALLVSMGLTGAVSAGAMAFGKPDFDFAEIRRSNVGLSGSCAQYEFKIERVCQSSDHPEIMIWGDSFAMHTVAGIVDRVGKGIVQTTAGACGSILNIAPIFPGKLAEWPQSCIDFNNDVLDYLKGSPSIKTVVLSTSYGGYIIRTIRLLRVGKNGERTEDLTNLDDVVESLGRTVETIRALGKDVVIIGPPPGVLYGMSGCAERKLLGKFIFGSQTCGVPIETYRTDTEQVNKLLDQVESEYRVKVVRISDATCDAEFCQTVIDGVPIYRDEAHLSYVGSVKVMERLRIENYL